MVENAARIGDNVTATSGRFFRTSSTSAVIQTVTNSPVGVRTVVRKAIRI
jgi:hypothetical protein